MAVKMPKFENSPEEYVQGYAKFFCEDARLSVPHFGTWARGLVIDGS